MFAPHVVPSAALRENAHTATPVLQSYVLTTHGVDGDEQSAPASHALHTPFEQKFIEPVPHGVPSATGVVAAHASPPSSHVSAPE